MHGTPCEIVPDNATVFPVSFAQQRLWFLEQLHPNSAVHHIPLALRLQGQLRVAALHQTLNAVVQRHEALRTTFGTLNEQPVQIIASSGRLELPVIDLSHQPEPARQVEIDRLLGEEARRPFDLSRDLMLRAKLFRWGPTEHVLSLVMHHIVSDGWSMAVLFRDLEVLYDAFCREQPVTLPALPIQYVDYAVWQREYLTGDELERQLRYWRELLANASPSLELPTTRPRPASPSYHGALVSQTLSPALGVALRELSRREGATLYMTLLAAFQTLLHRYSGQDDILVGSPIAGRTRVEIEGLIGLFVNTLVMRGQLAGNPSFRALLRQTRHQAVDAYAHQEVPFEKVVEELRPKRNLTQSPFFQVMFILQSAFTLDLKLTGLTTTFLPVHSGTSSFDLTFSLMERGSSLEMTVEYNTDLFDAETIQRLAGHYETLLEGIVANPDERIDQLPLLSKAQHRQLLEEWNATGQEFPKGECLHQLFEAQVERTPEAVAVVFEDKHLTYRKLNNRANQLAWQLHDCGVGPDVLVGLCVERSLELVVGLLGILKAGGAYVPIDPMYPAERVAFMLEDANAPVVLTQESLARTQPALKKANLICLDGEASAARDVRNPHFPVNAENLAYVLYTSGSTGKPKGTMIPHRAIVNHMRWMQSAFPLNERDCILQKTPISFDASVWEFYAPLFVGGRLVVARPEGHRDAVYLVKTINRHQVTILQLVPSLLRMLLETPAFKRCRSLRRVFCGGEALPGDLARTFCETLDAELHNLYGPTEVTIDSIFYSVRRDQLPEIVPIGRPVANTQAYILDGQRQPVPIGVAGELYLGGVQVGRGYHNRPELTAERFVADPFRQEPGGRLYRTGDKARYLPDGNIEFLERMDHQVKIRGYRIELGEIESALRRQAAVQEAVVMAREDVPGEKRLVAYVVAKEMPPADSELRALVKQKLPDYMVPLVFVFMKAFPLTPNGKVDRKALPVPQQSRDGCGKSFLAPRDPLEQQLAKLWEKIFGVEPIGIRDNFFELGGHSLLAVRLFAQVEKRTGKSLPLATLFQAPTIEQLVAILRREGWESPWASLVPIKPGGSHPPIYCVHGIGGNILEYLDLAKHMEEDQPFYGLQAIGLDGKRPIQNLSVEQMAAHYIEEIRAFQSHGPYYLAGSSFGGLVAYEMAQQLRATGEVIGLLALFDTNGPGYPRLLPTTTAWQQKWNWWRDRVQLHWGNLRASSGREKLAYVREKTRRWKKQMRWKRQHLWDQIRERAGRVFWPGAIKQARMVGYRAATNYTPKPYSGQATLFRATEQPRGIYPDHTLGWGGLVQGGLRIYSTPGHHGAIVREPRSRVLAQQLTDALHNAPTAKSASRHLTMEESTAVSMTGSLPSNILELGTTSAVLSDIP